MTKPLSLSLMLVTATTLTVLAQNTVRSDHIPVINIIKSPIVTKDLYRDRMKAGDEDLRTADMAVLSALRFFKRTQNADGSWGAVEERHLATPLVFMSFLRRGETSASAEFGVTVTRTRTWLLKATPTELADRIATVIALSDYCDLSYPNADIEMKADEVKKMTILLDQMATNEVNESNAWVDFAVFNTFSGDHSKPTWMRCSKQVKRKYVDTTVNLSPSIVSEYLTGYLVARASFMHGVEVWHKFNIMSLPKLLKQQESSGAFPTKTDQTRYVVTALATLRLEIYHQYAAPVPKIKGEVYRSKASIETGKE